MSLMTALVAPRLVGTLSGTSARASVKRIAAALRHARNQATSEKAVYAAAFHRQAARIAVGRILEASTPETGALQLVDPRVFSLAEGVRIESITRASGAPDDRDPAWILFYPNGASSGGRVMIADEKERLSGLAVDTIMGSVRVEE
jgi:Tfp pilus assembly protein FimT